MRTRIICGRLVSFSFRLFSLLALILLSVYSSLRSFCVVLTCHIDLGVMFWQFSGCSDSLAIMIITLLLSIIATIIQIFVSDVGSVLTSAIVAGYATYVCYSSVTLNPDATCNPTLQTGYQTVAIVRILYLCDFCRLLINLALHFR